MTKGLYTSVLQHLMSFEGRKNQGIISNIYTLPDFDVPSWLIRRTTCLGRSAGRQRGFLSFLATEQSTGTASCALPRARWTASLPSEQDEQQSDIMIPIHWTTVRHNDTALCLTRTSGIFQRSIFITPLLWALHPEQNQESSSPKVSSRVYASKHCSRVRPDCADWIHPPQHNKKEIG